MYNDILLLYYVILFLLSALFCWGQFHFRLGPVGAGLSRLALPRRMFRWPVRSLPGKSRIQLIQPGKCGIYQGKLGISGMPTILEPPVFCSSLRPLPTSCQTAHVSRWNLRGGVSFCQNISVKSPKNLCRTALRTTIMNNGLNPIV